MGEYNSWFKQGREIACKVPPAVYAICGLFGILTVCFFFLAAFYLLTYHLPSGFMLVLHAQNTVFSFLLAGLAVIVMLKTLFLSKRLVWWVWGTQTPDFEASKVESANDSDEDVVKTASRKGVRWTGGGFLFGYLFPLTGIYADPFMETSFIRNYPEIPYLDEIIGYIAGLPIFAEVGFVTSFLTIVHPVEILIAGSVLAPLTLGLWNLGYVFAKNGLFRDQVWENPFQRKSLYFAFMGFGVVGVGFLAWIVSLPV